MTVSWTWLKRWKNEEDPLAERPRGQGRPSGADGCTTTSVADGMRQAAWSAPDIGCNMIASTLGADLIMYGPIENVEAMITAQAYADIVVLEAVRDLGIEPQVDTHPFFRLI
jgi:tetrahydromethanopterin S-methyltransferase subunit H